MQTCNALYIRHTPIQQLLIIIILVAIVIIVTTSAVGVWAHMGAAKHSMSATVAPRGMYVYEPLVYMFWYHWVLKGTSTYRCIYREK